MRVVSAVHAASGVPALIERRRELRELHTAVGSPVAARLPWWCAALDADTAATPWLLCEPDRRGRLAAAALVAVRSDADGTLRVSAPRPASDDPWEIAGRSAPARRAVASALADVVETLERPWRLELRGVRGDDPVLDVVAGRLPGARVFAGAPVPLVALDRAGDAAALLRPSVREGLARSARRIARDGLREEVRFERNHPALLALRPDLEAAHRARDHDAGRPSDLDDDAGRRFWRAVYDHHALTGALEVATLRLGGRLSAYVVAFVDPPAYRVFDGRLVPSWRRYSPGRRLEAAVLERALADPTLRELDWMSSVAPEKLIAATGTTPTWTLRAASPAPAARRRPALEAVAAAM